MPPSHCGLWPAFWSYGDNWPHDGEIDIIEGVNMAHNNIISAHTADGCTQDSSIDGLYSGQQLNTQCAVGTENIGCGFNPSPEDVSSYGDGFNAAHGGVYAMEWNEEHIRIWHFARGSIPGDIENKEPDPESWGQPVAIFGGSSCDVDTYFKNMRLVLNINFCGDYGNAVWGKADTCNQVAPTCAEYVAENPEAFANAFWDVRYIDAYQYLPGGRNSRPDLWEPVTTTTMTTRATATVTVLGPGNLHRPPYLNSTRGFNNTHDNPIPIVPIEPAATKAPVNPIKINDYSYLGCFQSSSDFKSFREVNSGNDMALEKCIDLCQEKKYVGVFDTRCFCANHLDVRTAATQKEGLCSSVCPGDNRELCGGIIGGGGDGEGRLPGTFSNSTSSSSPFALTVYGRVAEEKPKAPPAMAPGSNEVAPKAYPHEPSWTAEVAEVTVFPVPEQGWQGNSEDGGSHETWNGNGWHDDGQQKEDGQDKDYKEESANGDDKWKWNPAKPEITEVLIPVTKTVTDCPESTTTKEHVVIPPAGPKPWDPADPKEHWSSVPPFGPLPPSPTPVDPKEHWSSVLQFGSSPSFPTPPPSHDVESHVSPHDGDAPFPPPFQTGAHPPLPQVIIAAAPGNHEGKEKYLVIMGLSLLAVVMGVL
ncbi:hypothetical protein ACHAPV_001672 [Trichoderma viride]